MKYLLVLSVLAACGGGEGDPHDDGSCDVAWQANGYTVCEQGCEDANRALNASGPSCAARTLDDANVQCSKTFVYGGDIGCCTTMSNEIHFADCQ